MMFKIQNISFFLIFQLLFVKQTMAQHAEDSTAITIKPYGSFRGHFAIYNGEMEFQENASRIGMALNLKKGNIGFIVGAEFQVNLFKGNSSFNVDGNLSGGFLVLQSSQTQQVLANRLGYLGVDLKQYGIFTAGKQWGLYYDITSYTDKFNVFGGQASSTYVGNTDGGENGTGRADQSLIYRNRIGPLRFGAQMQARSFNNGKFIDGLSFSSQAEIIKNLQIGAAYNKTFLGKTLITNGEVIGLTGQPTYFSAGIKYTSKKTDLGFVFAHETNGDLTQGILHFTSQGIVRPTVVFNATGIEFFGRYKLEKISFISGYNLYNPDVENITTSSGQKPVSPTFKRSNIIVGAEYRLIKLATFYAEQRISMGKTALGAKEMSVFAIGLKIEVEQTYKKMMSL